MENLKKIRKDRGIKQSEVARAIQVDQGTLSRYERGESKPDADTLKKLSEFFDVAIDYLVGNIGHPVSPKQVDFYYDYKKKSTEALLDEYDLHAGGVPLTKEQQATLLDLLKNSTIEEVDKMLKIFKAMQS
jgi:transcriptional regulator with XRE-family HTH domain